MRQDRSHSCCSWVHNKLSRKPYCTQEDNWTEIGDKNNNIIIKTLRFWSGSVLWRKFSSNHLISPDLYSNFAIERATTTQVFVTIFLQRSTFYLVGRENAFEWIPFHLWKICNQLIITHRHHPFNRRKSSVFQQRLLSVIKFYWLWGTIVGMFHGNCRFIHAKKVFKVFANQRTTTNEKQNNYTSSNIQLSWRRNSRRNQMKNPKQHLGDTCQEEKSTETTDIYVMLGNVMEDECCPDQFPLVSCP